MSYLEFEEYFVFIIKCINDSIYFDNISRVMKYSFHTHPVENKLANVETAHRKLHVRVDLNTMIGAPTETF